MALREVMLECREGNSDKYYHLRIDASRMDGEITYSVRGTYGRRGNTGQETLKGSFANYREAVECFDEVKNSKLHGRFGHRYQEVNGRSSISFPTTPEEAALPAMPTEDRSDLLDQIFAGDAANATTSEDRIIPQQLDEIEESEVENYINDDRFYAQQKFDGKRMLLKVCATNTPEGFTVQGINKKGDPCPAPSSYFERLDSLSTRHSVPFVIDGESIGDNYYAFDLVEGVGDNYYAFDLVEGVAVKASDRAYKDRLDLLHQIIPEGHPFFIPTARTSEEKRNLLESLRRSNAEGIVFKPCDMAYKGGHGVGCFKYKFYATASCIVTSHTPNKRSIHIGLKQNPVDRRIIPVGKCTIPPNKKIPAIGSIVEIRYLYGYPGGCLFQPIYLGERDDVDRNECLISQVKYKGTTEARGISTKPASPLKVRKITKVWEEENG